MGIIKRFASENYVAEQITTANNALESTVNQLSEEIDGLKKDIQDDGSYTNQLPLSTDTDRTTIYNGIGYKTGVRLSGSTGLEASSSGNLNQGISGFISPCNSGDVLRVKGFDGADGVACYVIAYDGNNNVTGYLQNSAEMVTGNSLTVTLDEATFGINFNAIRLSLNGLNGNTIVTINEEITDVKQNSNKLMFISPSGNDDSDGLTANTPKKTVNACVKAGAKRISAKRGVYAEQVSVTDVDSLEIFPTDNDQTYSKDVEWQSIVFDLADTIEVSSLTTYNSIKTVAYSNTTNEQFDKVFTKKSQTPIYSDGNGSRYNSTIWLLSSDEKTVCIKLKPVLTVSECEAETNTFTYVDGYIYINADLTNITQIKVPTNYDSGFRIANANNVVLKEVEVRFSGSYNIWLSNCPHIDLYKCSAKYSSYASGIDVDNVNGVLNNCYATKNYDGFGISGYGHTTYIDCVAEFNFDDGVSHHNGSKGTFIGGRYEGNGKGGNTPAYGSEVNIYGGLYKDNAQFGIGYLYTSTHNPARGMVQGAVMVGNLKGLQVDKNCDVIEMSCHYIDNTTDKVLNGNVVEYTTNYVKSVNNIKPNEDGNVAIDVGGIEETPAYTNVLPLAVNSDGSDYVGNNGEDGYKVDARLNSSGVEKEQAGICVTGFIPVKAGDVVRIKNFTPDTSGYGYMFTYKSDFSKYGNAYTGATMLGDMVDGVLTIDINTIFENSASVTAYIRFSAQSITEDTIVTINEEIA